MYRTPKPSPLQQTCLVALTLLGLSASASFAAAPIAGPGKGGSPANPASATGPSPGDITSPGDPFRPPVDTNKPDRGGNGGPFHSEERGRALPISTKGMACELGRTSTGVDYISVTNDTGTTIPAGSKVTVFIQPGNVARTFLVEKDWPAGQKLDLALKGLSVVAGADCAVRVKLEEAAPPPKDTSPAADTTLPEPPEPQPLETFGEVTGDTGPLQDLGDPSKVLSAACIIFPDGQVHLFNSGNVPWPAGTSFEVTLPNGQVFVFSGGGFVPDGSAQIPSELIYAPGAKPEVAPFLPDGWTCEINANLPS